MKSTCPDPIKTGATSATGATTLSGAAFRVAPPQKHGAKSAMICGGLHSFVAPVTPAKPAGATQKPAWILAVAPVAPQKAGKVKELQGHGRE